jgi:rhamnosyl/mannosyltransferase
MVQLEAMACGKPVVSTNLASGVPVGESAWRQRLVVPPGDVEGLRASLQAAHRRPRPPGQARQRCPDDGWNAKFTADRMARRTLEIYQEIAAP